MGEPMCRAPALSQCPELRSPCLAAGRASRGTDAPRPRCAAGREMLAGGRTLSRRIEGVGAQRLAEKKT